MKKMRNQYPNNEYIIRGNTTWAYLKNFQNRQRLQNHRERREQTPEDLLCRPDHPCQEESLNLELN